MGAKQRITVILCWASSKGALVRSNNYDICHAVQSYQTLYTFMQRSMCIFHPILFWIIWQKFNQVLASVHYSHFCPMHNMTDVPPRQFTLLWGIMVMIIFIITIITVIMHTLQLGVSWWWSSSSLSSFHRDPDLHFIIILIIMTMVFVIIILIIMISMKT